MNMKRFRWLFWFSCCATVGMSGAEIPYPLSSAVSLLKKGDLFLQEKRYDLATESFEELSQESDNRALNIRSAYGILKAEFAKEPSLENKAFTEFLSSYPTSVYLNEVFFMAGSAAFNRGEHELAFSYFAKVKWRLLPAEDAPYYLMRVGCASLLSDKREDARLYFSYLSDYSDRHHKTGLYYLSYMDYQEKKVDKALKGFLELEQDSVFGQIVPYYITQIYYQKELYAEAIAKGTPLADDPESSNKGELLRMMGESYYDLNRLDSAIVYLADYMDIESHPLRSASYKLGVAYFQSGNFLYALDHLSEVPLQESDLLSQNSLFYIGLCYLHLDDKYNARMAFERASGMDADDKLKEESLYNYAMIAHAQGASSFGESITLLEKFLNLFPHSKHADKVGTVMSEAYLATSNYESALRSIEKVKHPNTIIYQTKQKLYYYYGTQQFVAGSYQKAASAFSSSINLGLLREFSADSYYWRGECYFRDKSYPAAQKDWEQYLRMETKKTKDSYIQAHYGLGYALFLQKGYQAAQRRFLEFVEFDKRVETVMLADAYNRVGDCAFYLKRYTEAETGYQRSENIYPAGGDYPLFQRAFIQGLIGNQREKGHLMNRLMSVYPQSAYLNQAMYERGRALWLSQELDQAVSAFRELSQKYPAMATGRQGALSIGMIYAEGNRLEQASNAFKEVIQRYPGSDEAQVALDELKTMAIESNRMEEFSHYLTTINKSGYFKAGEEDSLTYIAAERLYMKQQYDPALKAFESYLRRFPNGGFALKAHYYSAQSYSGKGEVQRALEGYQKVYATSSGSLASQARIAAADLLYQSKEYDQGVTLYREALGAISSKEERIACMLAIVTGLSNLNRYPDLILAADDLLKDPQLNQETKNTILLLRAKAYMQIKDWKKGESDLLVLSSDKRTIEGAEATCLLSEVYFHQGRITDAESVVLNFIQVGTTHNYWLARSFILMSDIKASKGDTFQAKQYLLTLKENYRAQDDIASMIVERLSKLK